MSFSAQTNFEIHVDRGADLGAGVESFVRKFGFKLRLTDGLTANKSQEVCSIDDTIDTASDETWDLLSGDAGDNNCPGLQGDIAFASIQILAIRNKSTTAAEKLTLGASGANDFDPIYDDLATGKISIPPGGVRIMVNPAANGEAGIWTVDATHKLLQLAAASGAAVPFEMLIVGRGAPA